jgi:outer membrane protein assembly factor BamB
MVALDARTGRQRWATKLNFKAVTTTPVVDGGRVYVAGAGSCEATQLNLEALDATHGTERWQVGIGSRLFVSSGAASGPAVAKGVAVVGAAETNTQATVQPGPAGPSGGGAGFPTASVALQGLDGATGRKRWSITVPMTAQFIDAGDTVVFLSLDGSSTRSTATATAIDRATGRQRWQVSGFANQMVAGSDALYMLGTRPPASSTGPGTPSVGPTYLLGAFDSHTGEARWQVPLDGPMMGTPSVVGSIAVITTYRLAGPQSGPPSAVVVALDSATLWRQNPPGGTEASIAVGSGNNAVYVATPTGLTAVNPQTGTTQWTVPLTNPPSGGAGTIVAGAGIVALAAPGGAVVLDASDGHRLWALTTTTSRPTQLAIAHHNVYLTDGTNSCGSARGGG